MNLLDEHNKKYQFFVDITGVAMKVYNKYHYGLLESAYEAAMQYLLELNGHKVERQVFLPIYWDNVKLNQNYHMSGIVYIEEPTVHIIVPDITALSDIELDRYQRKQSAELKKGRSKAAELLIIHHRLQRNRCQCKENSHLFGIILIIAEENDRPRWYQI